MTILEETFTLHNGVKIPKLGLGTWQSAPEDAYNATLFALKNGYTHVDTAIVYGNETEVGRAVRDSGQKRENVFVTTKVPAERKTYQEAKESIEQALRELDLEYIDLMLIHAPRPWAIMHENPENLKYFEENREVWRALEEAYEAGSIKAIGVSNFDVKDLENIMEACKVKPMVNQIIYHIGKTNSEVLEFCKANDILVEGYSPIATGRLLGNEQIEKMATKYDKSIPQICIRYLLEKDILPLPKSVHEKYIIENAKLDFEIELEDMEYLDSIQ
ncbi:aldo/keto reductase [Globicatella sulfidifaciens]|uniref:aldo/keto reductase n=1 Tax=Globicatella sulfidifaciens TaxID=136093 RepID=UPI002891A934|nr:aldo/keto reductase [Globicatella sulfidifaciens]MDT2768554.1 aldo/keto reductase [Globicatella sulfidifaciens]